MSEKNNNRQELLDEAKQLGLEFHTNIKTDKLEELVLVNREDKQNNEDDLVDNSTPKDDTVTVPSAVLEKLIAQVATLEANQSKLPAQVPSTDRGQDSYVDDLVKAMTLSSGMKVSKGISVDETPDIAAKISKAMTLIRCTVISRDPSKSSQKVEVITVANDLVGEVRYKVPFNIVTHIPLFIYLTLKEKSVNIFDESVISGDKKTGEVSGGYTSVDAYSISVLAPLTKAELKALGKKQKLRSENLDEREDAIIGDEETEEEVTPSSELEALGYDI